MYRYLFNNYPFVYHLGSFSFFGNYCFKICRLKEDSLYQRALFAWPLIHIIRYLFLGNGEGVCINSPVWISDSQSVVQAPLRSPRDIFGESTKSKVFL